MERSIGSWWSTTLFMPPTPPNNVDSTQSSKAMLGTLGTSPSVASAPTQPVSNYYYSTLPTTLISNYYGTTKDSTPGVWQSTGTLYDSADDQQTMSTFSHGSDSSLSTLGASAINAASTSSIYSGTTLSAGPLSTLFSTVTAVTPTLSPSLFSSDAIDATAFMNHSLTSLLPSANMTTDAPDYADDRNIYILPLYQQIIWTIVFGSMIFVAAGGNLIVIWIVLNNKRMRTVTNYFLVNLSLADIMVSTLNVIFNFIYMLHGHWPFGQAYCKISNFIAILSVAASVFTLMAISIDRYLAIVHPLRPRMSRRTTLNIIVIVWIASSVLGLPNILYSTTVDELFANGDARVVCYLEWHDGPSNKSKIEYLYNIVILLVTYMLPIVSMIYTYFRVGLELWGSQSIGECTTKQMESIKSKRKIVKMMMIVVAIFGVCWAPYHSYFLLVHHYPAINDSPYAQQFYLAIYWLAMSNSMYNPFVYCWMNSRFRQGFRNVFCCVCCRPKEAARLYEKPRAYHLAARYTSNPGSEAGMGVTSDTRVRFNGNGNAVTLQPNSCADLAVMSNTVTGSSATSPMVHSRYASPFNREML